MVHMLILHVIYLSFQTDEAWNIIQTLRSHLNDYKISLTYTISGKSNKPTVLN